MDSHGQPLKLNEASFETAKKAHSHVLRSTISQLASSADGLSKMSTKWQVWQLERPQLTDVHTNTKTAFWLLLVGPTAQKSPELHRRILHAYVAVIYGVDTQHAVSGSGLYGSGTYRLAPRMDLGMKRPQLCSVDNCLGAPGQGPCQDARSLLS
jgi:hypothetical protein